MSDLKVHTPEALDAEKKTVIDVSHVEDSATHNKIADLTDYEAAIRAEEAERGMPFKEAIKLYKKAVGWSLVISLCIVMEGYDTALLGNFFGLPAFRERYGSLQPNGDYQLTASWQTALSQASTVGNIIGIFVASWFQDKYGYLRTIQISLIAMTCCIFIVFFAPRIEVLFVGFLLSGLPWGAFSSSCVSYASEITPVALRGYLTTYVNLCWIIGQFISAGVVLGLNSRTDEWAYRIPFAVQWIWVIPLFTACSLAPESPWFLVRQGRLIEAETVVRRLQKKGDTADPRDTVSMMVRTNEHEKNVDEGISFLDCFKGVDLRRTEIACLAWGAQNLSGLGFAGQIVYFFQSAGLSPSDSFKLNLGNTGLAFCATVFSWFLINRFGRRTIFVTGLCCLTGMMLLLGILTFPAKVSTGGKWAQCTMMLIWVAIYDATVGPLAYCIVGEVSSTRLRVKTVALARNFYNVVGIVSGILVTYQLSSGEGGFAWGGYTGFFWSGSALLITIWAYFRLPELKGRTYRELDILFERKVPARKFKQTEVSVRDEQ